MSHFEFPVKDLDTLSVVSVSMLLLAIENSQVSFLSSEDYFSEALRQVLIGYGGS